MTLEPPEQIFVVGSGRSGTTIVLESMASLPQMAAIPRLAGRVPSLTWLTTIAMKKGVGPKSWIRPSAESAGIFAEAGLTREFQGSLGGRSVGPEDARHLDMDRLSARFRSVREVSGARTLIVKNTANCARIPLLGATFPTSHFVHVVRDPRAVVASLLKVEFWPAMTLWWDGRTTREYGRDEGIGQAQVAARHWARQVSTVRTDLDRIPASRQMVLSYREFTNNPAEQLRRLSAWGINLGDQSFGQRIESLQIRPDQAGPGNFSEEISSAVALECANVLAGLEGLL